MRCLGSVRMIGIMRVGAILPDVGMQKSFAVKLASLGHYLPDSVLGHFTGWPIRNSPDAVWKISPGTNFLDSVWENRIHGILSIHSHSTCRLPNAVADGSGLNDSLPAI